MNNGPPVESRDDRVPDRPGLFEWEGRTPARNPYVLGIRIGLSLHAIAAVIVIAILLFRTQSLSPLYVVVAILYLLSLFQVVYLGVAVLMALLGRRLQVAAGLALTLGVSVLLLPATCLGLLGLSK